MAGASKPQEKGNPTAAALKAGIDTNSRSIRSIDASGVSAKVEGRKRKKNNKKKDKNQSNQPSSGESDSFISTVAATTATAAAASAAATVEAKVKKSKRNKKRKRKVKLSSVLESGISESADGVGEGVDGAREPLLLQQEALCDGASKRKKQRQHEHPRNDAAVESVKHNISGNGSSSSNGSGGSNSGGDVECGGVSYPYVVNDDDHCETPLQAYVDIVPLLNALAK